MPWLFGLVQLLIVGVIVLGFVLARRMVPNREQRAAQVASGEGRWYCIVLRPGVVHLEYFQDAFGPGELTLARGVLTFTKKNRAEPVWSLPANQLAVGVGGALQRRVRLYTPDLGELSIVVSHDPHLSMRSAGDSRAPLEQGIVDDVVRMLLNSGARPL